MPDQLTDGDEPVSRSIEAPQLLPVPVEGQQPRTQLSRDLGAQGMSGQASKNRLEWIEDHASVATTPEDSSGPKRGMFASHSQSAAP